MAPGINRTGKKWHPVIMDACRILKVLFALGKKSITSSFIIDYNVHYPQFSNNIKLNQVD